MVRRAAPGGASGVALALPPRATLGKDQDFVRGRCCEWWPGRLLFVHGSLMFVHGSLMLLVG